MASGALEIDDHTTVRDYLEWVVRSTPSSLHRKEQLVLKHGIEYRGTPWSAWQGRGWRRRKAKRCFNNAVSYEMTYDGLVYVEGFALLPSLPVLVHHAWCVTEDGRVVDPTWHDADDQTQYLGIPFGRVLSARLYLMEKGNHLAALLSAGSADDLLNEAASG